MKHQPRTIVIDWVNTIWETDLPPLAKLVACNLRKYMTGGKEMAYPGVKRVAGECGISDRSVQKYLALLCDEGWLINNGQSHLFTTIYAASIPPEVDSPPRNWCSRPPKLVQDTPEGASPNKVIKKVIDKNTDLDVKKDESREVFDYWVSVTGKSRAKFISARKSKITARLREGYSVDDLKMAIRGNKASEYHQGKNDDKKVYNDLELILRDGSYVERFMDMAKAQKRERVIY